MRINFKDIKVAALANAESLVRAWLPDGYREGKEWVVLNPTRSDMHTGSFKVNMVTGLWGDFARVNEGGDLVSLKAYLDGSSQEEAAASIARELNLPLGRFRKPSSIRFQKRNRRTPATGRKSIPQAPPAPARPPPETVQHPQRGKPTALWPYRNQSGDVVGFACRFEEGTGGKVVLPYSWTGAAWEWKAMPEPRPLYNLPKLLEDTRKVVLVVEGEKTADAASRLLPEFTVTTWPGGCRAYSKTDFLQLKGRRVVLWPDADEPGTEAMQAVKYILLSQVGVEKVLLVELPLGIPLHWDLADAEVEGMSYNQILFMMDGMKSPEGLCPICWFQGIAAPIGGPTCRHVEGFQWESSPDDLPGMPHFDDADSWEQYRAWPHVVPTE